VRPAIRQPMSIDPEQPIPIYFQLKTLLLEEILGGRYSQDDRLPTEHELCERFAISRTPVTRALSELAEEGVILRRRRLGSFVNPHWLSRRPDQAEVRVVVPAEGPWGRMIRDAASDVGQVSIVKVPRASLHQTLTHAVAEGVAPDLAVIDSVWTPEFAAAGFLHGLEDLDEEWIRSEHEGDFLHPLAASNRYGGRTFGIPAFADVAGLWYRRAELESRGLRPPTTWAELRDVARAIADGGTSPSIVMPGGSRGGETTAYCLIAFLASNGATVLEPGGVSLGSRKTAQALRFLRSLVEVGAMSTDVVAYEWNRPIRLLAEGHAAISFGGTYEVQTLREALRISHDELWSDFGFIEVPAGPRGACASVTGTMIYTVFRQAAQPVSAMKLLERAVATEPLARMAVTTGRIPSRRSAVSLASAKLPFVAETSEMLERAVARPWMPSYPRVSAQLQAMLEAVLTGRLTPAAAARRTADMIGAITGLPVVSDHPADAKPAPNRAKAAAAS
jgi:ABC-type glycerol-3-phosphate transport system substrate-binding protein/DNA-binding transcriptional regulator YhcF (GntR family)